MKFKKIMLITFVLLAILTIGAVSATEDMVSDDGLTVNDDGDSVDSPINDADLLSDGDDDDGDDGDDGEDDDDDEPYDGDYNITFYEDAIYNQEDDEETHVVEISAPDGSEGNILVTVEGEEWCIDEPIDDELDYDDEAEVYYLVPASFELDDGTYFVTVSYIEDGVTLATQSGTLTFNSSAESNIDPIEDGFDYQINAVETFDVNDIDAVVISLVCPDGVLGEFRIKVYKQGYADMVLIREVSHGIVAEDYNNVIAWAVKDLNITESGHYDFEVFFYDEDEEESYDIGTASSDAIDSNEYRIEGSFDEIDVNLFGYNVPVFSVYCPDGHQGEMVNVTVRFNYEVIYSGSKRVPNDDGVNYLDWTLGELNMAEYIGDYMIYVNANDGEFEESWTVWVKSPIDINDLTYINSLVDYEANMVLIELPVDFEGRIVIAVDGDEVFNKNLTEFPFVEDEHDYYFWHHPSHGPGDFDLRYKLYNIDSRLINEEGKYNVTAKIEYGSDSYASTVEVTVKNANVVEEDGYIIQLADESNVYYFDRVGEYIAFVTVPEGTSGKILVTSGEETLFEADLSDMEPVDGRYVIYSNALEIDGPGTYDINVAFFKGGSALMVEASGTFVFENTEWEDESPFYINDGVIVTKDIVGLEVDRNVTEGRIMVVDALTGEIYFNKTLAEMEYNTDWMEYKFRAYEGYYVFKEDLSINTSGRYQLTAVYEGDNSTTIITGEVYIDFDAYVNSDEVDVSENDTVLIKFYVFDMYNEGTIVIGSMIYGETEEEDEYVELYRKEITSEDIGQVISLTMADLNLTTGNYNVDVRFYSKNSVDEGDYEIIMENRKVSIVDNTEFRVKMDEELSILSDAKVFFVYCPEGSANEEIIIAVNGFILNHLITAEEAGDYIGFTLSQLNITSIGDYSFDVSDSIGTPLIETYFYSFKSPFELGETCVMESEDNFVLELRAPEGFDTGRIVIFDEEGTEIFNKTLSEIEPFSKGWDKGYIMYPVYDDDLINIELEEATYTFRALYVGDITIEKEWDIKFVKRNVVEKDGVSIELFDYNNHNLDDENEIAKVTAQDDKGHVVVHIIDNGDIIWDDEYNLYDDEGEYCRYVSVYGDFSSGTYLVNVSYYDKDDNLVLSSSAYMTFIHQDEFHDALLLYNHGEIELTGDADYNASTYVAAIVLDESTEGILIMSKDDIIIFNITTPGDNLGGDWGEYWPDGPSVYYVYLKDANFDGIEDGYIVELNYMTDNPDLERSLALRVVRGEDWIKFEEINPNEGAEYIFINSDNVNPDFDINTETNVTGKAIVMEGNETLWEYDLGEIAKYDDWDDRYHHNIHLDWNNMEEGDHTITIIYQDEDGNEVENRTFDIVIENWDTPGGYPEIFIMWSNWPDDNEVIYALDSTDLVHIYLYSDDSDLYNIRITVMIGDEVYLNDTIGNLDLEVQINDQDMPFYTVGPAHFTKNITAGYYDNVIAYYDSDYYHVSTADGDMPDYVTIVDNGSTPEPVAVDPELSIAPVSDVEEGTDVVISISALANFTGTVNVLVGSAEVGTAEITDGTGSFTIAADKLKVGENTVYITSEASEDFTAGEANVTFSVTGKVVPSVPVDPELAIAPVSDVEEGTPVTITISAIANFTGSVKVLVGSAEAGTADIADGAGSFTITADKLAVGENTVYITSEASDDFIAGEANVTFTVTAKPVVLVDPDLTVSVANIIEGQAAEVIITTNATFSGEVKVQVAGKNLTVTVNNGAGNVSVAGLAVGDYTAVATFDETEVFSSSVKDAPFTVLPNPVVLVDPELSVSIADITEGDPAVVVVQTNANFTGAVKVDINGTNYTVTVTNGLGNTTVSGLAVGDYLAVATFDATEVFAASSANDTFNVAEKVIPPVPVNPELAIAPVSDVEQDTPVTISISALANFTGTVKVLVGSAEVGNATVTEGAGSFTIAADKLAVGENTVYITSEASEDFTAGEANVTFSVTEKVIPPVPVDPKLSIAPVGDVEEGIPVGITISALANFTGTVNVSVGDKLVSTVDIVAGNGLYVLSPAELHVGEITVYVTSEASENFTAGSANVTFNVVAKQGGESNETNATDIVVIPDVVTEETFDVVLPENATGNVTVIIDGNATVVPLVNGSAQINVSELAPGSHSITIEYPGDENCAQFAKTVDVLIAPNQVSPELSIAPVSDIEEGNPVTISISALANFTGTVKVLVGSVEIGNATVSDGIGSYAIAADKLAVGANTVYVTSEDSVDFSADSASVTFTVTRKPVDPALTVKVADITEGANAVIVITTNATFSGNVKVQIAGSNLTVVVTNGSGSIPVSGLAVGTYTAVATFDATDVFTASTKNATFAVKAKVATSIKATAVKTTYGTSKKITITLTDANGKALANKKVIVELKGAKKELITDGKGQASYAIGTKLAPKKYTAKITFAGDSSYVKSTGSAKVTVNKAKPKLAAKKKSFKVKKAKKYTITLKTDKKKALKKAKVTLTVKVKGKKVKITKKTNAKGKATFNLKKLNKKGKYTATVKFAGNKNYKAATKKVKITIK